MKEAEIELYAAQIRQLVPIGDLTTNHQDEVIRIAEVVSVRKRKYLFRQGDQDNFSYYLLQGDLELSHDDQLMKVISGGAADARNPLAQLQPRQLSARAETAVQAMRVDRGLIDRLLTLDRPGGGAGGPEIAEFGEDDDDADWMTVVLQSELFSRIPPANIQQIFTRMEAMPVSAGDEIITQGAAGDHYYVVQRGRCEVTRKVDAGETVTLAMLKVGDSFGEEALVADARRNATITMVTDGELMRLTKQDFVELIQKPALDQVDYSNAQQMVAAGSRWLDVRQPDEHAVFALPDSLNIPVNSVRDNISKLDKDPAYIVYCDNGGRSAAAAFVLTQHGYTTYVLSGGLERAPVAAELELTGGVTAATAPATGDTEESEHDLSLTGELAQADLRMREALRGKAQADAALECLPQETVTVQAEQHELEERAQQASEELAQARKLKMEAIEAKRKVQAEQERHRAQMEQFKRAATRKLREEQAKLDAQASEKVKQAEAARRAAEAQLQTERDRIAQQAAEQVKSEQQRLEQEATRKLEAALQQKVAAEQARQQAEEEAKARLEEERQRRGEESSQAAAALAEARRLRAEIETQKRQAERSALEKQRAEEERIRALKAEAESRLRDEQARLEAQYREQAGEISKLQKLREDANAKLETERARVEAELAQARERMEEAKKLKIKMEAEKRQMEKAAERERAAQAQAEDQLRKQAQRRIDEERRRLESEFARTTQALAVAEKEKAAAEAARLAAAKEAERVIADQRAQFERMKKEEEQRLGEERERLERESQKMRRALAAAQRVKDQALIAKRAAEQEAAKLGEQADRAKNEAERSMLAARAAKVQAEAERKVANATQAHADARQAQLESDQGLVRNDAEQGQLRIQLEAELRAFMEDPNIAAGFSPDDTIDEDERDYLERIRERQREKKAVDASKNADLLDDIAAQLGGKK